MRLNPDCVRDTLLYLEEQLAINCKDNTFEFITLSQVTECMLIKYKNKYTEEDIWYTIYNLRQVHFIEGKFNDTGNHKMILCNIENITWNGHQFLETIRPNTIWEAVKNKAKQIGGISISGLSIISSSVIQGLASNPDFIQSIVDKMK
ncbi:DUF2513 domain-containing protein [Roseburia sp. 1XD42-69]|uniref:DUF2513 domain-containing protein n=1 Tax=Roseburia sp. 1XD42-69 TaxID=2320088 RepID=UPI000EA13051|nr:DUF2513 domain-containing protein [Roseburia sp. 1XD42-69]RKJ68920.1 DUF2513 domain-containing protein [Roseburia sp. 1XD42-69]